MRPLDGIKVVELATFVAAPVAARMMADWGAEVIRIETASGDNWRPHGRSYGLPHTDDCNPLYAVLHSGKKCISIDLKTAEGKEIMMKLLEDADVFVTNVRWASILKLGLDYDTLHEKFPRLIYFHFNGFGYHGPAASRPGFDTSAFWSMSGALHEFHSPDSPPQISPPSFGDVVSSNAVLSGILAAIIQRSRTGEGLRVTTSLYANAIWCNYSRIVGTQPRADGTPAPSYPKAAPDSPMPFTCIYRCEDGEYLLMQGNSLYSKRYTSIMKLLGLEHYLEDERFCTREGVYANHRFIYDTFAERFLTKPSEEWAALLQAADVPHSRIRRSREITSDEQAWANDYLTDLECPNGEHYVVPNSPVTFFGDERVHTKHVGGIGCDTSAVLAAHGYTPAQIDSFLARGIAAGK